MRIIHGVSSEPSRQSLFREFQFQLVPLIPYLAIANLILARSHIFHIFIHVENQPLKQRLKQKRRIILQTYDTFAHLLSYRKKLLYKIISFSF